MQIARVWDTQTIALHELWVWDTQFVCNIILVVSGECRDNSLTPYACVLSVRHSTHQLLSYWFIDVVSGECRELSHAKG